MSKIPGIFSLIALMVLLSVAQPADLNADDVVVLTEGLMIQIDAGEGMNFLAPDIIAALVETGQWESPSENDRIIWDGREVGTWTRITADENGWFRDRSLRNAYIYFRFNTKEAGNELILLEAMGNEFAYINGIARSGNPYANKDEYEDWETKFDYSLLPAELSDGDNEFLFQCNRGVLKVKLHPVQEGLYLNEKDVTIPDLRLNREADTYGALPIINATTKSYTNLFIKTRAGNAELRYYPVNKINPLSVYKSPFYISYPAVTNTGQIDLTVELMEGKGSDEKLLSSVIIQLTAVDEGESYKETFVSEMDGSVQYFGVNPPTNLKTKPALFLSLHGAGVKAINQAKSYASKNWGYVVAPTNRRPYGYNWENWGRLDALEVLAIAEKSFNIDKNRVYLTGHSMGGHGTWHVGINYPDRFAALGPSAGWISIWGYRINPNNITNNVAEMLVRSAKQSDTFAFATNLKQTGVYVIHGDADDIVKPEQSHSMIETIAEFHHDYYYHEEPGAGHWWDNTEGGGADCVDWKPMFDYFSRHSVPGKNRVKIIDFVTANPAISSKNNWIEIINQIEQQKLSRIEIRFDYYRRNFTGTTGNIKLLAIDVSMLDNDGPISVVLDGQLIEEIKYPGADRNGDTRIYLYKRNGVWNVGSEFSTENKYPGRYGNFREVLNHNVVFVYGTQGTHEKNNWAYRKARYDAERIWYQGNGSIDIIADNEFDPVKYRDRNVLLFGNANTNSAWDALLEDSPVRVENGVISVGNDVFTGEDLAVLMIRPRTDSDVASVGVIAGTGPEGMKLANLPHFHHPYVSLPDIVIFNGGVMNSDIEGVRLTGYFGNDWSMESGEFIRQ
jgi:fermentation-respiration switch protein FrsA (DUF1100 family)